MSGQNQETIAAAVARAESAEAKVRELRAVVERLDEYTNFNSGGSQERNEIKAMIRSALAAQEAAKPSECSGVAHDLERVARQLQSFADRLCNHAKVNAVIGLQYEGDESALREAVAHLRHQAKRAALAQPAEPVTAAARDVLAERARQISSEGWTPEHDDHYQNDELSLAAACYAIASDAAPQVEVPLIWPWPDDWWKPTTERRNLVKAGALILAEIERLDRAEGSAQ